MCLVLLAYKIHRDYPLIIAANRDEYYERHSVSAKFWEEYPNLLAGRDLQGGGTWLGITRNGKFAALTNYRDPKLFNVSSPSRGKIILNYLAGNIDVKSYLRELDCTRSSYNPFNLIAGRMDSLHYYSNINGTIEELKPGIHGLCNHFLNTPWPKVTKAKQGMKRILDTNHDVEIDSLLELMSDTVQADTNNLPDTGIGLQLEKMLSSICIKIDGYGTKATTIIRVRKDNEIVFFEQSFKDKLDAGKRVGFTFKYQNNTNLF